MLLADYGTFLHFHMNKQNDYHSIDDYYDQCATNEMYVWHKVKVEK